ncbi:hypothetical protein D9M72_543060 [compost metagenome]
MLDDPLPGVLPADVQLQRSPADRVCYGGEVVSGCGDVDDHQGGTVTVERAGDGRPDAACGPGHDGHLTGKRLFGVGGELTFPGCDGEGLAVDKG